MSMKRIALPIAARRTPRSLEVNAPSLNAGWPKRLVVAMPDAQAGLLQRVLEARDDLVLLGVAGAPRDQVVVVQRLTPHAPSSASLWTESTGSTRLARRAAERVPAGVADGPQTEREAMRDRGSRRPWRTWFLDIDTRLFNRRTPGSPASRLLSEDVNGFFAFCQTVK